MNVVGKPSIRDNGNRGVVAKPGKGGEGEPGIHHIASWMPMFINVLQGYTLC